VADCGSVDATRDIARAAGARVIEAVPGRAAQMNAGAAEASGSVLCFLHADSVLPGGWADEARRALGVPKTVAAAFDFAVAGAGTSASIISLVGRARWRLTRIPLGDQGLCVPKSVFESLGGFPALPVMEDLEFARRVRRLGKIAHLRASTLTSPRTWDEYGLLRPTAINAFGILAYRVGVSPQRIARWRERIAPTPPPAEKHTR